MSTTKAMKPVTMDDCTNVVWERILQYPLMSERMDEYFERNSASEPSKEIILWVRAINAVYDWLLENDEGKSKLMNFFLKRSEYVEEYAFTSKGRSLMREKLHISQATYYKWRSEILYMIALEAIRVGAEEAIPIF